MDRKEFNACIKERLSGKKLSKEERRFQFCLSAKICSGKASSEPEAESLCQRAPAAPAPSSERPAANEGGPVLPESGCENVIPMAEWVQMQKEGTCPPCVLQVPLSWYMDELGEHGYKSLVKELDKVRKSGDSLATTLLMDTIKEHVPEDLAERLREFDCAAQGFQGSA